MEYSPFAAIVADPYAFTLKLGLVACLIGLVMHVVHVRCRVLIARWAEHGGWQVVGCRRCFLDAGPFPLIPGMPVYRVEFRGVSGRTRVAHVRCGNFTMSVLSDEVAVEWADAAARAE